MNSEKEFLTTDEAAVELNIRPNRVRQLCRAGKLGQLVGRVYIIKPEEIERHKRERRPAGRPYGSRNKPREQRPSATI